ncbi:MAG: hypothetical protein IJ079_02055 [Lachnospiraceae bacterium]|nr:hypothetical protein [Lachnospiraceae bacterium]
MHGRYDNIKIQGITAAVPSTVEDNMEYADLMDPRRVKKQIKLTGVKRRHVVKKEQRASDLAYAAAVNLIENKRVDIHKVKICILITQAPNYQLPSTAFFLHKRLGLDKDCLVYDMNLGCSSFNVGVQTVSALLQACDVHTQALLLMSDSSGRAIDPEKNYTEDMITHNMLFGSAATAILLEKVEHNDLYFMNMSDGNGFQAIIKYVGNPASMDGPEVFRFAINDVTEGIQQFKNLYNIQEDMIDYYSFHQAQGLILDNIVDLCNIPPEKELRSIEEYGNTSGSSVLLNLCVNRDLLQPKDTCRFFISGFGVGLSWGYIYTTIDTCDIFPVMETGDHYDEDKI